MKMLAFPYANSCRELQTFTDWMEHQGLWGSHKVSVKRTNLRGMFILGNAVYGREGVWSIFVTRVDTKQRVNPQGFELKVE